MTNKLSIYVHVPFCESKCSYCAFSSFVAPVEQEKYFDCLCNEIESSKVRNRVVDTIYIGGGTPSCVEPKFIEKTLKMLKKHFKISKNAEISMECNPNSVNKEKLKKYFSLGINRISFGVQSLNAKALKSIGRLHTPKQAISAIKLARSIGFENINADLLIGLPGKSNLIADARKLIKAGVTHLSAYMLQVEDGTKLKAQVENRQIKLASDVKCVKSYEKLAQVLQKRNFLRYEISNFALKGYECKHNQKYWSRGEYVGFGLSAHSFLSGVRIANANNFTDYYAGKITTEKLSQEEVIEEVIMLGLRSNLGFSIKGLKSFGYDITQNSNFANYKAQNILRQTGDRIYLNPSYYGVSNFVITNLLPR